MALEDTDLLAVYRVSDLTSYRTTVSDIVDRVPNPAAPSLTAVLQENNISQGENIIIQDGVAGNNVIELTASLSGTNVFHNKTVFEGEVSMGTAESSVLTDSGDFLGVETGLLGDSTNGKALRVYAAGSTIATIEAGTASATTTITNTGDATFSGVLEADSISGGEYA